jgi:hypothetical protein
MRGRAALAAAAVVLVGTVTTGCTTHDVTAVHPCPVVTKKVVVVTHRGSIAMAKIGLTPRGLKAQTTCP